MTSVSMTVRPADPFTPTTVPNLVGWWRSDTLSGSDGDQITSWADSSGHAATMTSAAPYPRLALNAINGRSAADFHPTTYTGLTYFAFDFGSTNAQPNTIFVVMKYDDPTSTTVAVDGEDVGAGGGTRHAFYIASSTYRMYAGATLDTGLATNSSWHIHTGLFNGASSKYRIDGTEYTGNPGTNGVRNAVMGAQYDGDLRLDGRIAEYLFYDRGLTGTEMGQVEAFLSGKYRL